MHVRVTQQTHYARACVNIHGSRVTIFCGDPAHLGLRRPAWDPTGEHDEGTILHVDSQPSADTPRPPICRPERAVFTWKEVTGLAGTLQKTSSSFIHSLKPLMRL